MNKYPPLDKVLYADIRVQFIGKKEYSLLGKVIYLRRNLELDELLINNNKIYTKVFSAKFFEYIDGLDLYKKILESTKTPDIIKNIYNIILENPKKVKRFIPKDCGALEEIDFYRKVLSWGVLHRVNIKTAICNISYYGVGESIDKIVERKEIEIPWHVLVNDDLVTG